MSDSPRAKEIRKIKVVSDLCFYNSLKKHTVQSSVIIWDDASFVKLVLTQTQEISLHTPHPDPAMHFASLNLPQGGRGDFINSPSLDGRGQGEGDYVNLFNSFPIVIFHPSYLDVSSPPSFSPPFFVSLPSYLFLFSKSAGCFFDFHHNPKVRS